MNRKNFLKKFGIGLATITVAPAMLAGIGKEKPIEKLRPVIFKPKSISSHIICTDTNIEYINSYFAKYINDAIWLKS